jgi:class 3 adenylate cyclase
MEPAVGYAKRGDLHVAYQVQGSGPIDLLALTVGTTMSVDRDDEPHWARFDRGLASFSRLIRFDPCGYGLSDPLGGVPFTVESWMHDAIAVLDAVGSERAAVFGIANGGVVAQQFAATYPERTSALVLMHAWARLIRADDYPVGIPQHIVDRFITAVTNPEYEGEQLDDLAIMAPSLATDAEFRAWWLRAGTRHASPAGARAMNHLAAYADVREVLPTISVPTLVLHRVASQYIRIGHGRYVAQHISGAKLVELSGADHLPFVGNTDEVLGEIEEFLTGSRATANPDRVLATMLFSDIVDSTRRAAATGDRRWRELLDDHDNMAARQVRRFGGHRVKALGDGLLATFDGPARGIECGLALCDSARQLGLEVRVGLHTGEVERRGDDVAGIAVHIAARIEAHAPPGQVCVSRTVADLVTGSGIAFHDGGTHELKGVPGAWQLFTVKR